MARMRISVSRLVSFFIKGLSVGRFDVPISVSVCPSDNKVNLSIQKASLSAKTHIEKIAFEKIVLHTSLIHAVSVLGKYNFMLADGKYLELRDGKIFEVTE